MLLDYHAGEPLRRSIMSNAAAARRIYRANDGILWNSADGKAAQTELHVQEVTLSNQIADYFSTEDIMAGLRAHGPLMFSGAFVRMFGIRSYTKGHVIVVYGVEFDRVWYHDPQQGMERFEASQVLDWDVFSNYRKAGADHELAVHAI